MPNKMLLKFIIIAVTIYVVVGIILYFSQTLFLFHGKKLAASYTFNFGEQPFTEINITRADSTNLNVVKFTPTDTPIVGTVLYYHGNMHNINRYATYTKLFTINGYVVYMMDYPGFGKTTGTITEALLKADAQLVYNLVQQDSTKPLIIYGKSMGTGLATYIAAHNSCQQLILETPYYSLPTVYDDFTFIYPTKLMLKFQMNNYEQVPNIKCPITIFHGTNDRLISIANASRLKPLLKPTDMFVTIPSAGHNTIVNYPIYTTVMDSLLSK